MTSLFSVCVCVCAGMCVCASEVVSRWPSQMDTVVLEEISSLYSHLCSLRLQEPCDTVARLDPSNANY